MTDVFNPGASFTKEVTFLDFSNEPIAMRQVHWAILDPDGLTIASGMAGPDHEREGSWVANITIPEFNPTFKGKCKLTWFGVASKKSNNQTISELIEIKSLEPEIPVAEYLYVNSKRTVLTVTYQGVSNVKIKFFDGVGRAVDPKGKLTLKENGDLLEAKYIIQPNMLTPMEEPYTVEWTGVPDDQDEEELVDYQYVYAVTQTTISLANDLKAKVDKAGNTSLFETLQITPIDLIKYLKLGINRINSLPPMDAPFTLDNIHHSMRDLLVRAGGVELCSAQLMAEQVSSFDFSGQAVSLNVDRSQAWESLLGRLSEGLDDLITKAKANIKYRRHTVLLNIDPFGVTALRNSTRDTTGVLSTERYRHLRSRG